MGAKATAGGYGQRAVLLSPLTITTAVSATATTPVVNLAGMWSLVVEAQLTVGSGGTTVDVYVQTSLDGGLTWIDIMNFHFTTSTALKVSKVSLLTALAASVTPADGSLSANSILDGLLGDRIRVKYVTTGTYAGGTTLRVDAVAKS